MPAFGRVRWSGDERPDHLRRRIQVLRRSAWRKPRHSVVTAGHHESRRSERLRQDNADEPDDRPDPTDAWHLERHGNGAGKRLRFLPCRWLLRQFESFARGINGWDFVYDSLLLHGMGHKQASELTAEALNRVDIAQAAHRKIAGYSKGMRQKICLAQAIAHHPTVLVLD